MILFPDFINIKIYDIATENPIANIATKIKLYANHKNNYNFILPLSDDSGNIEITKKWLEEKIRKEKALFVMDYFSSLDDCKAKIEISILDTDALALTIDAMYLYQEYFGNTDDEINKYKKSQNFKYYPQNKFIELNDNSKVFIKIELKSK